MAKKLKTIDVAIKVSIPKAGEFLMTLRLDPTAVVGKDGQVDQHTFSRMNATEIKAAIVAALECVTCDLIKVTPLKGEIVKAEMKFQQWLGQRASG